MLLGIRPYQPATPAQFTRLERTGALIGDDFESFADPTSSPYATGVITTLLRQQCKAGNLETPGFSLLTNHTGNMSRADHTEPTSTTDCAEITEVDAFLARAEIETSWKDVVVRGLDLRPVDQHVHTIDWNGVTLLGCELHPDARRHVRDTGGVLFPRFDDLPYRPWRRTLYSVAELATNDLDRAIYEHQHGFRVRGDVPILEALAQRIHDHAIDRALDDHLNRFDQVVAIMGGHSLARSAPTYRTVATVARQLATAGYHVVTGGGPGAMEAGNLGAWMAAHDDAAFDDALASLATIDDYSAPGYMELADDVLARHPDGVESLAIPTWFYGHEPTNAFATAVAKYFSNSIREDGLLAIATHGVVYTPGAAGTVQEVFMDATQNHYVTFDVISPMVFLDSAYWADDRLAAPLLLRQLAGERPYAEMVAVLDDADAIVEFIRNHPPVDPADGLNG